ncbi:N-acetylglutamate synthase [Rubidibacter lacunae KORDI 51-2]|uniref:N-acetylglutamate synthase n=1 Tax=Rubidibacter lacunae KORDI 51-2 TaxID=582515 RepID=U5DN14_9CHRO|nr:GNAT family N-acetyltransferase [Rubidibacter lacunae]ERN43056.1 N-acetylglutamate synthase [Rubidibacter lacunae KORDI 51-2]
MPSVYRDFTIRPWKPRDREVAARVICSVLMEYGLPWQPEAADRDVVGVESHYWQTGGEFWVVERDSELVGTGAYYPRDRGDRAVEIRKMYLLPKARGQGLGWFLLQELEAAVAARDWHEIWLETATVLAAAVRLYERNGYQPATGVDTPRCDRIYVKNLRSPLPPSDR